MKKSRCVFCLLPVVLFLSVPAAKALNDSTGKDSASVRAVSLSDITVEASRTVSRLIDLPLPASILRSDQLRTGEVYSLKQVAVLVPNMVMPDYGSRLTSPVFIRGIGSRINAPSVGLYVDYVPYFDKSSFDFDFLDVEKVEVLKGPQGTLYGRNSMGGMIHVVSRSPMTHQGTHLFLSAAEYGSYRLKASHYSKLSDKLAFSLMGGYQHQDGFFTNQYSGKKVDWLNTYSGGGRLVCKPLDALTLDYTASAEYSKQGGYPYALYDAVSRKVNPVNYDRQSSYRRTLLSQALHAKYTAENWEVLQTLTGQYLDDAQLIDQDFSPDTLYFARQYQNQKMLSEELLFRSKGKHKVDWLFGLFGFVHRLDNKVSVDTYRSFLFYQKDYFQNLRGAAAFGQLTWHATNNFTLIGGLRLDGETSTMHYQYNGTSKGKKQPVVDTVYRSLNEHILLPKVALNYRMGGLSVYASYATGYKPGGYNSTFEKPEQLQFKSEKSYNYEAGLKGEVLNGVLFFDLALFTTDLRNQQIYRTAPSGRGSYLDNAGTSRNKGFEISASAKPLSGMDVLLSYGLTDATIKRYVKDTTTNYNGRKTPYIPRNTFSGQLSQEFRIHSLKYLDNVRLNVLYQYIGKQYWDLNNKFAQEGYGLLQAKAAFSYRNACVEFWGKNLLNTEYTAFLFESSNKQYAQTGKPAQLGVNITLDF